MVTEKQEDLHGGIKTEGGSSNDGIEGNCYEQNGKFGIGGMSGGEIKDGAKVAGVINESASNKIEIYITNKVDSLQSVNSAKTDRSRECDETDNTSVTFSVLGSVEPINAKKLKSLLLQLQKLSGDATIYIDDIELGSIRLILSGSQEGLERLEALFKSGELSEVFDIPVEDVRFIEPKISENSEDTTTIERKRLAFTIAGNIDEADLAKLKAAVVENSNSGEKAKIDQKSRLIQEIITGGGFRRNLSGVDLSGVDLSGVDLSGVDLSGVNLRDANLRDVNLIGADLSGADLSDDNLSNANLSNANLSNANLSNANLIGANLSNANLIGVNLIGTIIDTETKINNKWRLIWEIVNQRAKARDLSDTDLIGAYLSRAELIGATLSRAKLFGANLFGANLLEAKVENAQFGYNSGISEAMKQDLIKRGAIFEDSPGDRSSILVPR